MNLEFYSDAFFQMLGGVPLTLKLAATSIVFGAILALLFALMRLSGIKVLDWIARLYVFVFRGTPLLVHHRARDDHSS